MGLAMTDGQIALLEAYRETLLLWSSKMNLISLQSELDLPVRHFIDSLTLLPYLPAGPGTLLDIGSGAGFPAIPVKIFRTRPSRHPPRGLAKEVLLPQGGDSQAGSSGDFRPELPARGALEKGSQTLL